MSRIILALILVLFSPLSPAFGQDPVTWAPGDPDRIYSYVFHGPEVSLAAEAYGDDVARSFRTVREAASAIEVWRGRECSNEKHHYPCISRQNGVRLAVGRIAFSNTGGELVDRFYLKNGWALKRNAVCDGEILVAGNIATFLIEGGSPATADDAAICLGEAIAMGSGGGVEAVLMRQIVREVRRNPYLADPELELPAGFTGIGIGERLHSFSERIREWRGICASPSERYGTYDPATGQLVCEQQ